MGEPVRDFFCIGSCIPRSSESGDDTGDRLDDGFAIRREIVGRAPRVKAVAEVFIELREQWMNHGKAASVDRAPSSCIGGER